MKRTGAAKVQTKLFVKDTQQLQKELHYSKQLKRYDFVFS